MFLSLRQSATVSRSHRAARMQRDPTVNVAGRLSQMRLASFFQIFSLTCDTAPGACSGPWCFYTRFGDPRPRVKAAEAPDGGPFSLGRRPSVTYNAAAGECARHGAHLCSKAQRTNASIDTWSPP